MRFGLLLTCWCFALTFGLADARAGSLFGSTHLLPSPLTLSAGRFVYGTDIAYGITDFFQVGTNVLLDVYKVFNANAKISLLEFEDFAFAPTLGFETYNYRDISDSNPDLRVTSWLPGAVAAYQLLPSLAVFVGGNLNLTNTRLIVNDETKSGFVRGARFGSDLSWAYNPPVARKGSSKKPKGIGNVLSTGVSYDLTYKLFGVGLSHHWPGFQLGVHVYPGATKYPVQPIIAGGGSVDF